MPASEARIRANKENAKRSTGPKTEEGKQHSRANALKHGLTGQGVVLIEADAAEVDRRAASFAVELNASGDVGLALARRAALSSVRMERGADQQQAALIEHARKLDGEFVAPEGADEAEAARLRAEAARRSLFDASKEASLAWKYEAAAERSFFRCLKELREREKADRQEMKGDAVAQAQAQAEERMASFFRAEASFREMDEEFDALCDELGGPMSPRPANSPHPASMKGLVDLPIALPPGR